MPCADEGSDSNAVLKSLTQLQPLPMACVRDAAELAAAAFVDSPVYAYIFEHMATSERQLALAWLFERNITLRLPLGAANCAFGSASKAGNSEIVCFFLMEPPDAPEISAITMLLNGILQFPFRFGFRAFSRLLSVKAWYERRERELLGAHRSRFCSLERMVVRPGIQGLGVGSLCLSAAIERASDTGLGVLLSTQLPQNVAFYRRLGFEVIAEEPPPFAPHISNWFMGRPPPGDDGLLHICAATSGPPPSLQSPNPKLGIWVLVAVCVLGLAWRRTSP
jgi:GNAT superfamily N-acetyltransferase